MSVMLRWLELDCFGGDACLLVKSMAKALYHLDYAYLTRSGEFNPQENFSLNAKLASFLRVGWFDMPEDFHCLACVVLRD